MIDEHPIVNATGHRRGRTSGDAIRAVGPAWCARITVLLALVGAAVAATAPAASAASAEESTLSITSYADGQFVSGNRLALEGRADDGTVTVTADGAEPCTAPVADGIWRCAMTVPNGTVTLTATRTPPPSAVSPTPTPPAEVQADSVRITLHVLGAPSITDDGTIGTVVRGTGYPGATLVLAASGGQGSRESACAVVGSDGAWACTVDLPTGDYRMTARQSVPQHPEQSSPDSPAITVHVDRDPPPAPVITSPAAGAAADRDVVVRGTGDSGSSVSVFVDGSLACSSVVSGGAWSCGLRLPTGASRITAVQRDAVGNYSAPSGSVTVSVATASPTATPTPGTTPTPTPPPAPTESSPPSANGGAPAAPSPDAVGSVGSAWSTPTGFGGTLPAVATAFQGPALVAALGAGAAFVALIALPLRLARTAIGPRIRVPRVFGRNRDHVEPRTGTPTRSIVAMAVGWIAVVVAAATLQGTPEYVRLVGVVVVSLALLNLVGVVLTGGIVARLTGTTRTVRLVPAVLVVGVVGAVISSAAGIEPPVILGIVLATSMPGTEGRRSGSLVQLAQLGVIEALALAAWVGHGATGSVGLWGVGLRESLAAVAISGLCSVVALLLPVGGPPGRTVFERSRIAWVAAAVPASGCAALVLGQGVSAVGALTVATIVGAGCLAIWGWVRFVEPALAERA